jgi:hypothetical protein
MTTTQTAPPIGGELTAWYSQPAADALKEWRKKHQGDPAQVWEWKQGGVWHTAIKEAASNDV